MSLPSRPSGPYQMPGKTKAAVIILWIGAVLGCIGGGLTFVAAGDVAAADQSFVTVIAVVLIASAALNAAFAIAIQKQQNWARITAIVLCAIGVAGQAVALFSGNVTSVIGLGLNIVIIAMLASADSKEWCRG